MVSFPGVFVMERMWWEASINLIFGGSAFSLFHYLKVICCAQPYTRILYEPSSSLPQHHWVLHSFTVSNSDAPFCFHHASLFGRSLISELKASMRVPSHTDQAHLPNKCLSRPQKRGSRKKGKERNEKRIKSCRGAIITEEI